MSQPDITPEDTAEMRREGSFREYLRAEMGRGRHLADQGSKKPPPAPPPGRRPGGWPPGTRPPDPPPPIPDHEIARAVAEHRAWVAAGSPPGDYRCECPNCRTLEGGTR